MSPKSINWETYLEDFPDRYINPGRFDAMLESILSGFSEPVEALDVGGGRTGTLALNRPNVRAWLADPFIKSCPDWMVSNLCQDQCTTSIYMIPERTHQRFDLVVARGSFNYLAPNEIYTVGELLKPGGLFFFNTFTSAKNSERPYINSKTGKKGLEKSIVEENTVRHFLIEENGEEIEHCFNVYNRDRIEYSMAAAELEPTYEEHGNSLYVRAIKPIRL